MQERYRSLLKIHCNLTILRIYLAVLPFLSPLIICLQPEILGECLGHIQTRDTKHVASKQICNIKARENNLFGVAITLCENSILRAISKCCLNIYTTSEHLAALWLLRNLETKHQTNNFTANVMIANSKHRTSRKYCRKWYNVASTKWHLLLCCEIIRKMCHTRIATFY